MNGRVSIVYLKSLYLVQRTLPLAHPQRRYGRWMSRRPSSLIPPETFSNQDKVIDLTEHYVQRNQEEEDNEGYVPQPGDGAFPLKKFKTKSALERQPETDIKKGIFDLEAIDAQTQGIKIKKSTKENPSKLMDGLHFASRKKDKIQENTDPVISIDVFDSNGNFVYDKLPYKDAVVGNRIIKLKNRKNRGRLGQFLTEGWRLIADGLQAGCKLDTLIFSQTEDLESLRPFMPQKGVKIYKMPYREMQMWSHLDTCPGIMGIFMTPNLTEDKRKDIYPINVICDNVRDPGNLGSILRACLGVGCNSVLLTAGCVDLWDNKVVRSAAGAHFRMPIKSCVSWKAISNIIDTNSTVLIADSNTNEDLIIKYNKRSSTGNQQMEDATESDSEEENVQTMSEGKLPIVQYFKMDYARMNSITLIVGGETEGISEECYEFAQERTGIRINIPLSSGVDSLNSSMALGVIAFEMRKQLMQTGLTPNRRDAKVTSLEN